ncbi:MAG TPA: YicC family protein [Ruminococcaceae bacterium]|nr:YicC family protein [Oscillospiraceae bacterium]
MIRSMTGFGRAEKNIGGRTILVEVKSVNHRFLDCGVRVPRGYEFLEEKLKARVQRDVSRGKVDVLVLIDAPEDEAARVEINRPLAAGYLAALRELQRQYGLKDDVTAGLLARFPDVLTAVREPEDRDAVWSGVSEVMNGAMASFLAMREAEGTRLKEDLSARGGTILRLVGEIEKRSPRTVEEYRQKLKERLDVLLNGAAVDEQRIVTEAAIFAERVSVTEEVVRLRSHVAQFDGMLEKGGPAGRRLDFLVQEMNREANTIGSKCADAEIAHKVVDLKSEIEKIREQIQNIE